jgi:hypothetical protein
VSPRAACVVVAALIAACGDSHRGPPDPWAPGSGSSIVAQPHRITLHGPGSEPRTVLRYTGAAVDRELRVRLRDRDHDRQVIADLRYRVRCKATRCTYQMTRMGPDDMPDEIRKDFERIVPHVHGGLDVPQTGEVVVRSTSLMTTTPSTTEIFELAVVPFPQEPIGIGARWTVQRGRRMRTFTLVAHDAATATVAMTAELSDGGAKLTDAGSLTISLADPFARGELAQVQVMDLGGSDSHEFRMTLALE